MSQENSGGTNERDKGNNYYTRAFRSTHLKTLSQSDTATDILAEVDMLLDE